MKTRICSTCREELPLTFDYFYRSNREKYGFEYRCKNCLRLKKKKYQESEQAKTNRNKRDKNRRQSSHGQEMKQRHRLKYKFNLTLEQYDQMVEQQNGKCAICNQIDISGKRLAVDHDHQTGKIRGLLCSNCNLLLGRVESTPELFSKMMKYLSI